DARLATMGQAIESLSKLSDNVERIRDEFTGFRSFRERIEGYEKGVKDKLRGILWSGFAAVVAAVSAAFYFGWTMSSIRGDVGDMKAAVEKLQANTYELNGTIKGQDERLKGQDEHMKTMEDRLKSMQVAIGETSAKTASETSNKTSELIAGVLDAYGKRIE